MLVFYNLHSNLTTYCLQMEEIIIQKLHKVYTVSGSTKSHYYKAHMAYVESVIVIH
jgi:fructose-1,6-bisphosphatase